MSRGEEHGRLATRIACFATVACLAVLGLSECSTRASTWTAAPTVFTWAQSTGPFVENFNPFSPTHADSGEGLIYEPLMMPDVHNDAERPWLATSYKWSEGGRQLTITLRSGVQWSDGRPFTAADVAFTFNAIRTTPGLNLDAIPLSDASEKNATTVILSFTRPAYQYLADIMNTAIKPAFLFRGVKNLVTAKIKHPVGTGPYLLKGFSSQVITYVRNPLYWDQKDVRIPEIRHLAFDSQASLLEALEAGKVTLANLVLPKPERKSIEAHFKFLRFYVAPIVVTPLLLNLTKYPFNLVQVRKAISDAIDRPKLTNVAVGGVYFPATSPTGVDSYTDASAIAPQYRALKFHHSLTEAETLLEETGFKKSTNGLFVTPRGQVFKFSILIPATFVNYVSLAEGMARELRRVGIEMNLQSASATAVTADIQRGEYDAAFAPELTNASPSAWFTAYLDVAGYQPVGVPTETDLERLQDASVGRVLSAYVGSEPGTSTHTELRDELEGFMVKQLPVIPVFVNTDMGDYNTSHFSGWPSAKNPYADPAPLRYNLEEFLTHLVPRKS